MGRTAVPHTKGRARSTHPTLPTGCHRRKAVAPPRPAQATIGSCSSKKAVTATVATMPKPKIAIVYYSMYGHVRTLALAEKKGLEAAGCEVTLLKVPETLSDEVLDKMGAPGVGKDDEEASAATLTDYDGFLFGLSARFGMASAQVKALLDSTGGLWQAGAA